MKPKKSKKQTKQDGVRQEEIEKRLKSEKVELDHSKGKERFEQAIKRAIKKKPR